MTECFFYLKFPRTCSVEEFTVHVLTNAFFSVLEAQLAQLSSRLKTWDGPKEQGIDTSYICVFLPGELSSRSVLLYPSLRDLAPPGGLVVHQLCKSFDMKSLQYSETVYNCLHFINAKGVVPVVPIPTEYIVGNLVAAWAYAELSTSEVYLQYMCIYLG